MIDDDDALRLDLWDACADDLRRWARAFADSLGTMTGLPLDQALSLRLVELADELDRRVEKRKAP